MDKPCPDQILRMYHNDHDVAISQEHKALYPSLHFCAEWDFMVIDRYCPEYAACGCKGSEEYPYVPALTIYIDRRLHSLPNQLGSGCAVSLDVKDPEIWQSLNGKSELLGGLNIYWNGRDHVNGSRYLSALDFLSCWHGRSLEYSPWDRLAMMFIAFLPNESLVVLEWR